MLRFQDFLDRALSPQLERFGAQIVFFCMLSTCYQTAKTPDVRLLRKRLPPDDFRCHPPDRYRTLCLKTHTVPHNSDDFNLQIFFQMEFTRKVHQYLCQANMKKLFFSKILKS